MKQEIAAKISGTTGVSLKQTLAVLRLLEEGATIPFIARYRKEATGELDEVRILALRDAYQQAEELEKRRSSIIASLEERELLTEDLEKKIRAAVSMTRLEDLYLPFRPKKRTRGTAAREAGLEPLARWILDKALGAPLEEPLKKGNGAGCSGKEMEQSASSYMNPEADIDNTEKALSGARDILAESFNEDSEVRQIMRRQFESRGAMISKAARGKKEDPEAQKYRDYMDWSEPAAKAPSHRILAVLRGVEEGVLSVHFLPDEKETLNLLKKRVLGTVQQRSNAALNQVSEALEDSYKRLIAPALETAFRKECKERADKEAIGVFASNVRELLMAAPLGQKRVLALDPGLRTGCKLVCLSAQGALLHQGVIYPLPPKKQEAESAREIRRLCETWDIEALAVGNGTGGREAEGFARRAVKGLKTRSGSDIAVVMVNESGASIYSASEVAREEFPDQDLTVRGAVSIGRRLMDPLAELVKIDPRSIGVGQYQHDVNQKELQQSLDDVVRSCVNAVGVEVNTASKQLLSYVSGISPRTAGSIQKYRDEKGPFQSREALKKVSGLGPKAFEQAAGFLRIRGGKNPLDQSAVHPESYPVVEQMARDRDCSPAELMLGKELRKEIPLERYVTEKTGMPTLKDILQELEKPGRDPREGFEAFEFSDSVHEIEDLQEGMILPGIVTNVTAFGAFVDLGVHQDGLVHISQLADRFVRDPEEVVKVNQKVTARVMEVDLKRRRISLSMKGLSRD